jgi:hypothetical protein
MATLTELETLFGNGDLQAKVRAAVVQAAQICIYGEDTTDPPWAVGNEVNRDKLAVAIIQNPGNYAPRFQALVIAANSASTVAQILAATDEAIQSNVNEAYDVIATAIYG